MLPTMKIGNLEITRLVAGTNPFSGKSHMDENTDADMKSYFSDEKARGIVSYAVSYEDGSVELANGYYGREIGSFDFSFERLRNPEESAGVEIDDDVEGKSDKMLPCYYSFKSEWVGSLAYNAAPIIGEDNSLFCFEWKNPHPGKKIVKIRPYNITHFSDRKNGTLVYLFGIGAISDSK